MKARVGMKKDGTITAVAGTWLIDTGYYTMMTQSQIAVGCGEVQIAVHCPNWDLKPVIVCTNRSASGSVRGFGGQAVSNAVGTWLHEYPLTPDKVLRALGKTGVTGKEGTL